MPVCPDHAVEMVRTSAGKFGHRHDCPAAGCTVVCWEGSTSTPGDAETRKLRNLCHQRFDPLWRDHPKKFVTRGVAYQWMRKVMRLRRDVCHIGMFDKVLCRMLLAELEKLQSTETIR